MATGNYGKKICIVTTIDLSLDKLFPDFYPLLIDKNYEVVGICAEGTHIENIRRQGVRVITVPMTREFTPVQDSKCLWMLYKIFKHEKFDIIHYSTPKAALLTAVAGRLVRCPALIYSLRGLGYTAFSGLKRAVAKFCEKIACRYAHLVIAISNSLKDEAIKEKLLQANRIKVLGAGSSKGVNLDQFQLNEKTTAGANNIRRSLGIGNSDVVIGYAGRFAEEKGIIELLQAFENICRRNNKVHLILVGDQDQRNPLPDKIFATIKEHQNIQMIPWQENVSSYIAAMDIFVLASYREGFGNSLIEASAMQVPVVATDIPGCRDAVVNGKTGLFVKPHDAMHLEKALNELIENPSKRIMMGKNGKQWVRKNFDRKTIWARLIEVYEQMLPNSHRP